MKKVHNLFNHRGSLGLFCGKTREKVSLIVTGGIFRKMSDHQNGEAEVPSKKIKVDDNKTDENKQEGIEDLSNFQFCRVLSDFGQRKTICFEGSFKDREGKAVVWFDKPPFSADVVKALCTEKSKLKTVFRNDIYGNYSCYTDPELNEIKTTIIYPATEEHISRHLSKNTYLIEETAEHYNNITLPFIQKEQFDIKWVYNVLEHKKEEEKIVFEDTDKDTGFILLPDLKWNGKQTEDLYLLALVHPRGIKSLRDLGPQHLPLLKNILDKGTKAISDKYNIPRTQLRIYIHYQPTFYHLHVHFNYLKFEAPGIFCEKSHLLSSVINNIELKGDYYQKATLSFVATDGHNLCLEYLSKGIIEKLPENLQKSE